MKLIYHPDEFLEKKLTDVDIKNPSFDYYSRQKPTKNPYYFIYQTQIRLFKIR